MGDPDYSAMNARKALEHIARALYEMKHIPVSDRTSLFELVDGEPFSEVDWVGVFGPQTQGVGKFVGYIHDIVVA